MALDHEAVEPRCFRERRATVPAEGTGSLLAGDQKRRQIDAHAVEGSGLGKSGGNARAGTGA